MKNNLLVAAYLVSVVIANLAIAAFGPRATAIVAFLLIGLDLTSRDALHEAWRKRRLLPRMALLISAGSLISWLINREAGAVALASLVAFAAAGLVDAVCYHLLKERMWLVKINGSNIPSALVDSLLFPSLAFGALMPAVIAAQFFAKVAGGFVWSFVLRQFFRRSALR